MRLLTATPVTIDRAEQIVSEHHSSTKRLTGCDALTIRNCSPLYPQAALQREMLAISSTTMKLDSSITLVAGLSGIHYAFSKQASRETICFCGSRACSSIRPLMEVIVSCDEGELTMANNYVNDEVLVSTQWVAEHLNDPKVRIIESNEDRAIYTQGHIPGAVELDWQVDLQDQTRRDYIDRASFEKLVGSRGIDNNTTVVIYGDKNNWWACYAFWVFKLFGHADCRIMNGGRKRWQLDGREWSSDRVDYPLTSYTAQEQDGSIRSFREQVLKHQQSGKSLVDVRSPEEYCGDRRHMPEYPDEGALRGGHIPGAVNVPWSMAVNDDGTFKSARELTQLYQKTIRLKRHSPIVAYCRIGERSSLTWFVLTYLLGFSKVKNYDGSWLEWGNCVGVPIVKGTSPNGQTAEIPQIAAPI